MEIRVRGSVVTVLGEIDLSNSDRVLEAMDTVGEEVLLDLAGVTFIDSSGVLALLSNGPFRVVLISPQVRRVLEILGLGDLAPPVHGDL